MEFAVQVMIVIFTGVLGVIGFVLKLAINRMIARADAINTQLANLSNSMGAMTVWQSQHESHDNERHQENLQRFENIFEALT